MISGASTLSKGIFRSRPLIGRSLFRFDAGCKQERWPLFHLARKKCPEFLGRRDLCVKAKPRQGCSQFRGFQTRINFGVELADHRAWSAGRSHKSMPSVRIETDL